MKGARPAALAALAALAFAGCGEDASDGDEAQITEAIERVATSGDLAVCTELQTQRFTEQVVGEGLSGEKAVKACEANAELGVADGAEVSAIEADGETATANVALTGSTFDSQTLELGLVREESGSSTSSADSPSSTAKRSTSRSRPSSRSSPHRSSPSALPRP